MEPSQVIDLLEKAETEQEARKIIRNHRKLPGISQAYFLRVATYFGEDAGEAIRLGRHWRSFASHGDYPGFAYRVRGIYERLNARWLASANAFIKAGEVCTDPIDRLAFQTGAVDSLARAGRVEEAVSLGERLADELEGLGHPERAAHVLHNLGNALLYQDRMEQARVVLERALPLLQNAKAEREAASCEMSLSSTHLFGGDPKLAEAHARAAKERASSIGADYLCDLCDLNLALVAIILGRPDEGLDILLPLRERFKDVPVEFTRTLEYLGDAYYRLNLWPESIDAYTEAAARERAMLPLHRANIELGLGHAYIATGEYLKARQHLARARRRYLRLGNLAWAAAARGAEASCHFACGSATRAEKAISEAAQLATEAKSPFHLCETYLLQAHTDSRILSRAAKLVDGNGYRGFAWRVHHLRARHSSGPSRLRHYRSMFDEIVNGRIAIRSLSSRASYLRDKSEAVKEYLALLLEKPTPARVAEVVDVIERTRSVTLLDEILSSSSLSQEHLAQIESVREKLREQISHETPKGHTRRAVSLDPAMARLQREWLNATHSIHSALTANVPRHGQGTVVLTEVQGSLYALSEDQAVRLPMRLKDLEQKLKWLQFELLAPIADRDSDPEQCIELLQEMGEGLLKPWIGKWSPSISPDGALWKVPWPLCLHAIGYEKEPRLLLHPALGRESEYRLPNNPRVALWVSAFEDLPNAASEANLFLQAFPSAQVCRSAAEARESLSQQFDVLHVISHARHRWANPMFSTIEFNDGPVFAAEIARSTLSIDLVCLSACDTGSMSLVLREEPDGLARAFLARGARNVLASMWPLDDEAAAKMVQPFYDSLNRGEKVEEALALARAKTREWRSHPYFWGPLALYGGYGR